MRQLLLFLSFILLYACNGSHQQQSLQTDSLSINKTDSMHAESVFMKLWTDESVKPADIKALERTIAKFDSVCNENCKMQVAYNAAGEIVKLSMKTVNETGELVTLTNQYYRNLNLFYVENLADVLTDPQSSIIFKGFVKDHAIEKVLIAKTMNVNGFLVDYHDIRADQIEFITNPVEKINENKPHPVNHDYVGE